MGYYVYTADRWGHQNHGCHENYPAADKHRDLLVSQGHKRAWVTESREGFGEVLCPRATD